MPWLCGLLLSFIPTYTLGYILLCICLTGQSIDLAYVRFTGCTVDIEQEHDALRFHNVTSVDVSAPDDITTSSCTGCMHTIPVY